MHYHVVGRYDDGEFVSFLKENNIEPIKQGSVLVYQNGSYILVFGLFFVLSLIQVYFGFKIVDKNKV